MKHELKLIAAVFVLNTLLLAALLTAMLGVLPTPQTVLQARAVTAAATDA